MGAEGDSMATELVKREYKECYVAFIDVLGFKEIIRKKSCDYIAHIFDVIHGTVDLIHGYDFTNINSESMKKLNIRVMSDSICVLIEKRVEDAFATLLVACALFQAELLHCMPEPVLLRGAIVCGDIYDQGDIIYGPALTRAYLMEQNNAKNPRIIITKELLDDVSANSPDDSTIRGLIGKMTSCEADAFYALDCIGFLTVLDRNSGEDLNKLNNYTEQVLSTTIDESIRQKFLYMRDVLAKYCRLNLS